jgi:hypothetical protein
LTIRMGRAHWECRGAHVPRCRQLCKGPCTGAGSGGGGGGGGRRAPGSTTAAHGAAAGATRPRTPTGGGASTIYRKAHTKNNKGHKHTTSPGLHTSVCEQWLRHITTKAWTKQQGGSNTTQSHHNEYMQKRSRDAVALALAETPRTTTRGRGGRRGGGCCRGCGAGRDGGRRGVRWEHGREQLHKGQWGVRDTPCKGKDLADRGA